ncbi:MAG: signal peptidase II [Clostridia bacterium]|nr:signal peptidase II [Clostridia bacterium]
MFQGLIVAVTAVLVGLDQLTKWLAIVYLKGKPDVTFIPGVIDFHYVPNDGAAWSILSGERWFLIVLTGIILAALLVFVLMGKFRRFTMFNISATLILAGGIGNLIDRLVQGYVVDFIKTTFMDFPVFNVADCFIVVGSVLLLVFFLFFYEEKTPAEVSHGNETDTPSGS